MEPLISFCAVLQVQGLVDVVWGRLRGGGGGDRRDAVKNLIQFQGDGVHGVTQVEEDILKIMG